MRGGRLVVVLGATLVACTGAPSVHPPPDMATEPIPIRSLETGKLAFLAGEGFSIFGRLHLYVADPDGGRPVRLTPRPRSYTALAWSPDGSRLAYAESFGEFGGGRIWVAAPPTWERRLVMETDAILGGDLAWSPDGRWLVYYASTGTLGTGSVQYSLFVVAPEGGDPFRLTEGPVDTFDPAWSPDGTRIAFDGELIGRGNPGWDLYVMDADGSGVRDLTPTTALPEREPSWSPDGSWIAFRSGDPGTRVELIRPDGSDRKVIYECECDDILSGPTWMPDGSTLAIVEWGGRIMLMRPDGSDVRPLELELSSPTPSTMCCLAWQPRSGSA